MEYGDRLLFNETSVNFLPQAASHTNLLINRSAMRQLIATAYPSSPNAAGNIQRPAESHKGRTFSPCRSVPGLRATITGGAGHPPGLRWEGKLVLTTAPWSKITATGIPEGFRSLESGRVAPRGEEAAEPGTHVGCVQTKSPLTLRSAGFVITRQQPTFPPPRGGRLGPTRL